MTLPDGVKSGAVQGVNILDVFLDNISIHPDVNRVLVSDALLHVCTKGSFAE